MLPVNPPDTGARHRDGDVPRVDADVVHAAGALAAVDSLVRGGRIAAHGGLRRRLSRAEKEGQPQDERGGRSPGAHDALLRGRAGGWGANGRGTNGRALHGLPLFVAKAFFGAAGVRLRSAGDGSGSTWKERGRRVRGVHSTPPRPERPRPAHLRAFTGSGAAGGEDTRFPRHGIFSDSGIRIREPARPPHHLPGIISGGSERMAGREPSLPACAHHSSEAAMRPVRRDPSGTPSPSRPPA